MNCDWNICVSIQSYILTAVCMAIMIILTIYNLNKQRKCQTDDRRCDVLQQDGTQKLVCQNGDGTWLPRCRVPFSSIFQHDRVLSSWLAAVKNNGRQDDWRGLVFLVALPGKVLKLIVISVSLQMKVFS